MLNPTQPNIKLVNSSDYRESYANSVQVRVNVWDFFLVFGTLQQHSETQVEVRNFQGIYLSPEHAARSNRADFIRRWFSRCSSSDCSRCTSLCCACRISGTKPGITFLRL